MTVAGWLEALPSDVVRRDSRLCLIWAWYLRNRGRLAEVEPWLEAAESEPSQGTLRDGSASVASAAATVRALSAIFEGDVGRALAAAQRAHELEADKSSQGYVRASVALVLSLFRSGKQADAVKPLEETVRVGQSTRQELPVVHALGCLAALRLEGADPLGAEELVGKPLTLPTSAMLESSCRHLSPISFAGGCSSRGASSHGRRLSSSAGSSLPAERATECRSRTGSWRSQASAVLAAIGATPTEPLTRHDGLSSPASTPASSARFS